MKRAGFTMIELVFIIVILGILGAIAVPKMAASRADAQIVAIKQDIGTILQAVPAYYLSQGKIERISDAVSINQGIWHETNGGKTLESLIRFKEDWKGCVEIHLDNLENENARIWVKLRTGGDDVKYEECKKLRAALGDETLVNDKNYAEVKLKSTGVKFD